ncbi:MAG: T9SS type A sorting domain-containing protein [Bacteroidia bacterium]
MNIPDLNFKNKLIVLGIDTSGDGEIQVAEAQATVTMTLSYSNISNLTGIEAFTNLNYLYCSSNQLTALDVSMLPNLWYLECQSNNLSSLIVGNINLVDLDCHDNQLTSLDLTGCPILDDVKCFSNYLTSLTVINLKTLSCENNSLSTLQLSGCSKMTTLTCLNNPLLFLNVANCTKLSSLHCANTLLTDLDVSDCQALNSLACGSNPNLTTLSIKNGKNESSLNFQNCPNLHYVCADYNELANVQQKAAQFGLNALSINTFCAYLPSGSFNMVVGNALLDQDNNGCANNDPVYSHLPLQLNTGNVSFYTYTNLTGNYTLPLLSGSYTLAPQMPNTNYFSVSPASTAINFANNNNNQQNQNFCISPNGNFPDVEIALFSAAAPRPGFDAVYTLIFKNKGTTVASGDISYTFLGNKMDFLNASVPPVSQTSGQLTWTYTNLQPFETRAITVFMKVLPPPINQIGDQLSFIASISLPNETTPSDNVQPLNEIEVGAYDPNDKTCLEGKLLSNNKIGEYLHYLVRFQNTGNYHAENVVVVDSLNTNFYDLSSIEIIKTSHDAHIDLKDNVLQFYFENIMLADSFSNEPESHGYVVFKIKTKNTLPQNASISNKVEIYFDYNLPVITNLETTTFTDLVGIEDNTQTAHFQCYPNPAQTTLTIETPKLTHFSLVNMMGETLRTFEIEGKENIDIAALPQGIYVLKAKEGGAGIVFVKE